MLTKRKRKDLLVEANAKLAEARNKLHNIESQTVLPLRTRIAELEQENARLGRRLVLAERMHGLYKESWSAMVDLLAAVQNLATGK
jgi:hypothetical protein